MCFRHEQHEDIEHAVPFFMDYATTHNFLFPFSFVYIGDFFASSRFFFTSRNVVKIMENIDIMSLSFSFQYLLMRNNSQFCPLQFLFSSFHFSSSFFKSRDSLCLFSNIGCLYEFKCGSTWDTYFMS